MKRHNDQGKTYKRKHLHIMVPAGSRDHDCHGRKQAAGRYSTGRQTAGRKVGERKEGKEGGKKEGREGDTGSRVDF